MLIVAVPMLVVNLVMDIARVLPVLCVVMVGASLALVAVVAVDVSRGHAKSACHGGDSRWTTAPTLFSSLALLSAPLLAHLLCLSLHLTPLLSGLALQLPPLASPLLAELAMLAALLPV